MTGPESNELDDRVQPGDCGVFDAAMPEFLSGENQRIFMDLESEPIADVRLRGFQLLMQLQKEGGAFGVTVAIPPQLAIVSNDLFERWQEQGSAFTESQEETLFEKAADMIAKSASGQIAVRRWAYDPAMQAEGKYPPGPTFNGLVDPKQAVASVGKVFEYYASQYTGESELQVGAFFQEWADPVGIPEVIGRHTELPRGGSARVIRKTRDGVLIQVEGVFGDNSAVRKPGAQVDRWVYFVDNSGSIFTVDSMSQLSLKNSLLIHRFEQPHPKAEKMHDSEAGGDKNDSGWWKIDLPYCRLDSQSLSDLEAVRMAAVVARLSQVTESPMLIEFSAGVTDPETGKMELIVNQATPWDLTREKRSDTTLVSGEVDVHITGPDSINTLHRKFRELKFQKLDRPVVLYIDPSIIVKRNQETYSIFTALGEVRDRLIILLPSSETEHAAREWLEGTHHKVILLGKSLNTDFERHPYVKVRRLEGQKVLEVVQSSARFEETMGEVQRAEQIMSSNLGISLPEAVMEGIATPAAIGGKAVGLAELIEAGCDNVPSSLVLGSGFIEKLFKHFGIHAWRDYQKIRMLKTPEGLKNTFQRILEEIHVNQDRVPVELMNEVAASISASKGFGDDAKISVRSNNSFEDRYPYMSFAGRFESKLDVNYNSAEDLYRAILLVLESYFQPDVVDTVWSHAKPDDRREMFHNFGAQLLLQPMVKDVVAAGVGFSQRRVLNGPEMVIELESKVGGIVGGGSEKRRIQIVFDPTVRRLSAFYMDREVMLGKTAEDLPQEINDMLCCLDSDDMTAIFGALSILSDRLGFPVDVELALGSLPGEEGQHWIFLQQRPLPQS